jgi:hypothetical protein
MGPPYVPRAAPSKFTVLRTSGVTGGALEWRCVETKTAPHIPTMNNPASFNNRTPFLWLMLATLLGLVATTQARADWVWVDGYSETVWVEGYTQTVWVEEYAVTEWVEEYAYEEIVTVDVQLPDGSWRTETYNQLVWVAGHWKETILPGHYETICHEGHYETIYREGHWVWEDDGGPQP